MACPVGIVQSGLPQMHARQRIQPVTLSSSGKDDRRKGNMTLKHVKLHIINSIRAVANAYLKKTVYPTSNV